MEVLRPAAEWELSSLLKSCTEKRVAIEIMGAGSKRGIGRPVQTQFAVSTSSLRGISLYEPAELVMAARAGTTLVQVEAELAARGQMLAFEPVDPGPMLGTAADSQTMGGVFAVNLSGARRFRSGGARDHLLGITAINGRGESFKSGGRVMKNVTGYDVARGLVGSFGTLAIFTEVTFKVLPRAQASVTLAYAGLPDAVAVEALCVAASAPLEVSGAAHLTKGLASRLSNKRLGALAAPLTLLRLEGFSRAIDGRRASLVEALRIYGSPVVVEADDSVALWEGLRRLIVLPFGPSLVWRISTAPNKAAGLVASIARHMPVEAYYDWAGGLVWLETPATADAGAADIRRAVATHGGHATLIRAEPEVRATVEVFQPPNLGVERLSKGLKAAFDPANLLNPERMYAGV